MHVINARENLLCAALGVLAAEREEPHAHSDDDSAYRDEQLALAARDLAEATEALPADEQPVGWTRPDDARSRVRDAVTGGEA